MRPESEPESAEKAFIAVYHEESDAIFRFCITRVSDRDQAIDITQETFTRLWQAFLKDTVMVNRRAFIFTIAHHLIIDWYRKKKSISLESLAREDSSEGYEPPNETARQDLELETEGRYILDKIHQLGPSYRHAVYLRFVEGFSPPEIAEVLGISANAASVRVSRGIEELRKITGYVIPSEIDAATGKDHAS